MLQRVKTAKTFFGGRIVNINLNNSVYSLLCGFHGNYFSFKINSTKKFFLALFFILPKFVSVIIEQDILVKEIVFS